MIAQLYPDLLGHSSQYLHTRMDVSLLTWKMWIAKKCVTCRWSSYSDAHVFTLVIEEKKTNTIEVEERRRFIERCHCGSFLLEPQHGGNVFERVGLLKTSSLPTSCLRNMKQRIVLPSLSFRRPSVHRLITTSHVIVRIAPSCEVASTYLTSTCQRTSCVTKVAVKSNSGTGEAHQWCIDAASLAIPKRTSALRLPPPIPHFTAL